jgi:exopolyphosphatase
MAQSLCAANTDLASVTDFVRSVKRRVEAAADSDDTKPSASPHLVIGNEAGDADSILSAIGLAYVKALLTAGDTDDEDELVVPIVSVPAEMLKFQRPETTFLLSDCAGMENAKADVNDLIAIDQPDLLPKEATLTLTDHNFFRGKEGFDWVVTEIVDHHSDEGKHTDTCPPSKRNIAFEDCVATVASTTTLVAEAFYASAGTSKMPPSLAILLLGTIVLDSIDMSPKAGKGTPRDAAAIQRIMDDTDWTQLTLPEEILAIDDDGKKSSVPDPTKLFDKLQDAKCSPEFWNGLTAEQAIRMDFKSFSIPASADSPSTTSAKSSLGIGTILLKMDDYLDQHGIGLLETMGRVIEEDQSEMLGLMFSNFGNGGQKSRQIALASYDKSTLDDLVDYLTIDTTTTPDLKLEILDRENGIVGNGETLHMIRMEQRNVKASRKQVAPILMEFFQKQR